MRNVQPPTGCHAMPCPTSNDKLKRQATAQPTALQEADREGQPVAAQQPVGRLTILTVTCGKKYIEL